MKNLKMNQMNALVSKCSFLALALCVLFVRCSSDDDNGPGPEPAQSKYVLITASASAPVPPGYATAFDAMPSGNISNITPNSLQGMGFGGWRPYGNWLLKMFNTEAGALGIERLDVSADGTISPGAFISADNSTFGSGNFVIVDDTHGYYWDGASPLKIQTFNPTNLSRTGELDLTAAVNERGVDEAGILFRSVGQKFLAVKGGKLFANITYAKTNSTQKGYFDDFYPDVYIAVIDITTGQYEKTIKIEDTGSIAYINENNMYDFDTNGDLYIVTQGRSAIGGKSKISRIKASETDVDPDWNLNMDDIFVGGKFAAVFAKDGKLVTVIPNTALTAGPTGNINTGEIWDFYSIDAATKSRTKISGIPSVTNPGGAFPVVELDGKVLLRVNAPTKSINGYYELNTSDLTTTQVFNVTEGGSLSGIYKVDIP